MFKSSSHSRLYNTIGLFALLLFLVLSIASSLTNRPQVDEGMFANPALNLVNEGRLSTTVFETEKSPLTRIEERTYWVMPLFLLNVAASFEVFGPSLFSMRLVSVSWGLILILAWYFIAFKISGDRFVALLCLVFLALDYTVLDTTSLGRMDMMTASLGFSGISLYLLLRERNLVLAIVLSQSAVALSGLTHPNGILYLAGLLFLIIYFDYRAIAFKHVAYGLLPYLVLGSAFAYWVMQDPAAFKDQFIAQLFMGGRMQGFSTPFSGIIREFTERYPHAFGLAANSSGHIGPIQLKGLILVGYIVGTAGVIFTKELRQNRKYFAALILAGVFFLLLSFLDGQKETPYLIHIIPFYSFFLASWLLWVWRHSRLKRPILVFAAAAFVALQAGGMAMRIRLNTNGNLYEPTISFLKENTTPGDLIMGGADLGFGLAFPQNLVADALFGFYSGRRPKFIVVDGQVMDSWMKSRDSFPTFDEYFRRLLEEEYSVAYENVGYKVYQRVGQP